MSYLGPVIVVLLFGAALWVLQRQLKQYGYHEAILSLRRIPEIRLLAAIALTSLNYLVLTGYDFLALRSIRRPLPYPKIAMASFIGYAFSNNTGFAMLAGSSVCYRLYTAWGLTAFEIIKVVAFYTLTLWIGLFAVAGSAFILEPMPLPRWLHLPFSSSRQIGLLLLLLLAAYLLLPMLRKRPVSIRGWEVPVPSLGLSVLQIAVSALDWTIGAAILKVFERSAIDSKGAAIPSVLSRRRMFHRFSRG